MGGALGGVLVLAAAAGACYYFAAKSAAPAAASVVSAAAPASGSGAEALSNPSYINPMSKRHIQLPGGAHTARSVVKDLLKAPA